jgi:RNA methyltransferase, TrmH family
MSRRSFPASPGKPAFAGRAAPSAVPAHSLAVSHDTLITSRDNRWLKTFRAALRGTGPEPGEPIALEGPKLAEEAVRSGLEIDALLVSESGEQSLGAILQAARDTEHGIPRTKILRTTDKLFSGVAATETPQGIAALVRPREWNFDDLLRGRATPDGAYLGNSTLIVVIAGVQDPGNVGTIVRSAEAFSATGVVAARGSADPWSPKALRASAGSALRMPLLRGIAVPILLTQLRVAGLKIYAGASRAADPEPSAAPNRAPRPDWNIPSAIFIGSEGAGLAPEILHAADAVASIPMNESVESLNAGVAASLLLYEAARQRQQQAAQP